MLPVCIIPLEDMIFKVKYRMKNRITGRISMKDYAITILEYGVQIGFPMPWYFPDTMEMGKELM